MRRSVRRAVSELVVDGRELKPYDYREVDIDGFLLIEAKVKMTWEEFDQQVEFERQHQGNIYFSVVRRGVSEEPIEMRFGSCSWSEHGAASGERGYEIRYLVRLVEKDYDTGQGQDPDKAPDFLDMFGQLEGELAETRELIEGLARLLVRTGVVKEEYEAGWREHAAKRRFRRQVEYDKVRDIDVQFDFARD